MLIFLAVWLILIPINFFLFYIINRFVIDDRSSKIPISEALLISVVPVMNVFVVFILIGVCVRYLFELITETEIYKQMNIKFKGEDPNNLEDKTC